MRWVFAVTAILIVAMNMVLPPAEGVTTPSEIFEASVLNQVIKRNKLIAGMEVKSFPFEYTDKGGQPTGFDVDMAKLLAKELGVELEIKDIAWIDLIPSLQSGTVDLVISGMARTLERAKTITFTDPYFETGLCALLSKQKAGTIENVQDLDAPERVLAVKAGTTGDFITGRLFPKAQVNRLKDDAACVGEVVAGRADAFLDDQLSIARHYKENPETTRAILEPFTYEAFAMGIRKGDADFLGWLNLFIDTIQGDGRYEELYQNYFSELLPTN